MFENQKHLREKKLRASPGGTAMSSPKVLKEKKTADNSPARMLVPNRSNEDLIEELEIENTADDQVVHRKTTDHSSDLSRGSEKGQIILPDLEEAMNIEENSNTNKEQEEEKIKSVPADPEETPLF